eukprot:SAG31_NODE_418_length_15893_cov_5.433899_15_plen_157_part_00
MLTHADDRGLQLGWSVFDTCNVEHGQIYALDFHIDRFFHSMKLAKISPPMSKAEMHTVVSDTVAAGIVATGVDPLRSHAMVRFWASAGVGGTDNSAGPAPAEPVAAAFYVKVSYLRTMQDPQLYAKFSYRPTSADGGATAVSGFLPGSCSAAEQDN